MYIYILYDNVMPIYQEEIFIIQSQYSLCISIYVGLCIHIYLQKDI